VFQVHRAISQSAVAALLLTFAPFVSRAEQAAIVAPVEATGVQTQLATQPKAAEINSLWEQGQKSKAKKSLSAWMDAEKNSPWPWVQAARISFDEKKYKRSLSYLKTALEKSPQCADAYYWRGRNYEEQKKPMDAANEYRAALLAQEKFEAAQEGLNRVLALLGPQ
jgi:tetratricopeptide (TPR) repeat protein